MRSGHGGTSLRGLLGGTAVAGRVLSTHGPAVYVGHPEGRVLGVVARDGLHLPNAVILTRPAAADPLAGLSPGGTVRLGDGALTTPGLVVRVRTWEDRRLWAPTPEAAPLDRRLDALERALTDLAPVGQEPREALTAFAAALRGGGRPEALAAADRLIGRGPGLTPTGDDLLAGALVAARVLSGPAASKEAGRIGAAVAAAARDRTPDLSATLLWHAARGEPARPARGLLLALAGRTPLPAALRRLAAVGHTSGRDLAHGIVAGARAAAARGAPLRVPSTAPAESR